MEINCDLGENLTFLENGTDRKFMNFVNAINIACTYHAGSNYIIEKTIENALEAGVSIGFHPSFKDIENFGRKEILLNLEQIKDLIFEQYQIIHLIASRLGAKIRHIKPHGALYNMSASTELYAKAIAQATIEIRHDLILLGLSGSYSVSEAQKLGLTTQSEVFADRAYDHNGKLISRSVAVAVLRDKNQIEKQARAFFENKEIETISREYISLKADTICVHSDTPAGLEIAKLLQKIKNEKI